MKSLKKAQSTFEYIALVAAVLVVLIVFLNPSGPFRNTVERLLNQSINQISDVTNSLNFQE